MKLPYYFHTQELHKWAVPGQVHSILSGVKDAVNDHLVIEVIVPTTHLQHLQRLVLFMQPLKFILRRSLPPVLIEAAF